MIADDEKDSGRRNELIKELVTKHKDKAPKSMEICRIFLDTIFAPAGKEKPLDLAAVNRVLDEHPRKRPQQRRVLRRLVPQEPRRSARTRRSTSSTARSRGTP